MTCFQKLHGGLQPCSGTRATRWLRCLGSIHVTPKKGEAAPSSERCFRQPPTEKVAISQKQTHLLTRNNFTVRIFKAGRSGTPTRRYCTVQDQGLTPAADHAHTVTLLCSAITCRYTTGEVFMPVAPGTVSTLHVSRGIATLPGCLSCTLFMFASGQPWHLTSAVNAVLLVTSLLFPEHSAATELATPSPG